jgi:hypothetical protein
MSKYREELEQTIVDTMMGTQAVTPRVAHALATLIVRDLFRTEHWEAIQEYLNERVSDELPPMDAEGKLI